MTNKVKISKWKKFKKNKILNFKNKTNKKFNIKINNMSNNSLMMIMNKKINKNNKILKKIKKNDKVYNNQILNLIKNKIL